VTDSDFLHLEHKWRMVPSLVVEGRRALTGSNKFLLSRPTLCGSNNAMCCSRPLESLTVRQLIKIELGIMSLSLNALGNCNA